MRFGVLGYWKDPVASPPRLRAQKAGHQRKFSPVEEVEFLKLLQKQIDDGTVVVVPLDWPAYTCPVHTVPKKGGKWRLVWDGRAVNAEQVSIHFRMEGVETAQDAMLPRDWGCKIDLESAFNHVWVSLEMQRFYCFRYADKAYSYVGMPFGSKQAPRLFTEALGYAIRFIRETWDVRIIVYMDDLLILQHDYDKCRLYTLDSSVSAGTRMDLVDQKMLFRPLACFRVLGMVVGYGVAIAPNDEGHAQCHVMAASDMAESDVEACVGVSQGLRGLGRVIELPPRTDPTGQPVLARDAQCTRNDDTPNRLGREESAPPLARGRDALLVEAGTTEYSLLFCQASIPSDVNYGCVGWGVVCPPHYAVDAASRV
jgi:hypothetical protein